MRAPRPPLIGAIKKGGKKYVTLLIASVYTGKTIFEMSGTKKSMYQAKYHT